MLGKLIAYFNMMVSLTLYGLRALRKTDKTQLKKGQKSFTFIISTKSKHLFSSCMDCKNICNQITVVAMFSLLMPHWRTNKKLTQVLFILKHGNEFWSLFSAGIKSMRK